MIEIFRYTFPIGYSNYEPIWWTIFHAFRSKVYYEELIDSQYGKVKWQPNPDLFDQCLIIENGSDCLQIDCKWTPRLDRLEVHASSQEFADFIETMWVMNR